MGRYVLRITSYIWNILQQNPLKINIPVSRQLLLPKSGSRKKLNMDAHDNVEGKLLEYMTNERQLSSVASLTRDQYERWTEQISEAITYLHAKKLI